MSPKIDTQEDLSEAVVRKAVDETIVFSPARLAQIGEDSLRQIDRNATLPSLKSAYQEESKEPSRNRILDFLETIEDLIYIGKKWAGWN